MKVLNDFQKNSKRIPNAEPELHQQPDSLIYALGELRLNPSERILLKEGVPLALAAKTFDLLLVLIRNQGHLLTKTRLLEELWPNTFVCEANLSTHIAKLRKVLGDKVKGERFIETVPKHGYRLIAPVRAVKDSRSGVVLSKGRAGDSPIGWLGSPSVSPGDGLDDSAIEENRARQLCGDIIHDISSMERLRVVAREAASDSDVVVLICRRVG
jgi:DNA-binding winged helix-turn-helix (wHTH) protein